MLNKIKTHFKTKKNVYFAFGSGMLITGIFSYLTYTTNSDALVIQKIRQVGFKNESNPVVINLVERSTQSKPVHLVGTNLYFDSLSEAARQTGHHLSMISKHINGHIPDLNGDVFELLEKAG